MDKDHLDDIAYEHVVFSEKKSLAGQCTMTFGGKEFGRNP